jgi:alkyl hydroperoxide reductase subunit AhpC
MPPWFAVYGKQKIYFALQADFDKLSPEEVASLDKELEELKKEHAAILSKCSQAEGGVSWFKLEEMVS